MCDCVHMCMHLCMHACARTNVCVAVGVNMYVCEILPNFCRTCP